MTVTYSLQVSTSGLLTFIRVLFRWRGSVYKALWKELLAFLALYFLLKCVYLFGLNQHGKGVFDQIAHYCESAEDYIPLSFILGFYVTIVFNRWWSQFQAIAWPDSVCLFTACHLTGTDERSRLYRRTIARYVNLSAVLGLRMGSTAVKKRFPTMEHLIEAGIMTDAELKAYEAVPTRFAQQWVPCQWAMNLAVRARKENRISSDFALIELLQAINNFRLLVRDTSFFDWMSIPLVYTQVVTLAVYAFFASCLMGHQHNHRKQMDSEDDLVYFPFFTTLQFVFYVGWLKVAECMINPYGEDDDDFEVNFMIDRNLQTGYVFADDNYDVVPPLGHDLFWDNQEVYIPHTAASYGIKSEEFDGSASGIRIPLKMTDLVLAQTASTGGSISQPRSIHGLMRKVSTVIGFSPYNRRQEKASRKFSESTADSWSRKSTTSSRDQKLPDFLPSTLNGNMVPASPVQPKRHPSGLLTIPLSNHPFTRQSSVQSSQRSNGGAMARLTPSVFVTQGEELLPVAVVVTEQGQQTLSERLQSLPSYSPPSFKVQKVLDDASHPQQATKPAFPIQHLDSISEDSGNATVSSTASSNYNQND